MTLETRNVLFICTGNSARSILAESILNTLGVGRFRGFSAGSQPTGKLSPNAVTLLKSLNHPTANLRSKNWLEFTQPGAPALHFIFTVCDQAAGETCPIWPGKPISAHWGLPDPAAVTGSQETIAGAFSETYRLLNQIIGAFVSLPIDSLDKHELQERLEKIGSDHRELA
ncbi:MAG: hypothetical protein CL573_00380 [Alphaproteobacteria bacterium]|nr:hypothetical protein [Alphaproteobacteria bacterium]HCP00893.1 hypothetical protein [Rhodospirillaceae bacterium]|tara:strand:- start:403 stop:912 length:510 start_codon:yes stop_codon:yes gene_type:complete